MKIFGQDDLFSVKYKFLVGPFHEDGVLGESWGKFEFWVRGKELCKFWRNNYEHTYEWNLIYLVSWMVENLSFIVQEEEFPLPVPGKTTLELLANSLAFESENDDVFDEWFSIKQDWEFKHSWFSSRGGSYLPAVYFKRNGDQMEISWNNEGLYNDEICFLHKIGVDYIPISMFEEVLQAFMEDVLKTLSLQTEYINQYERLSDKLSGADMNRTMYPPKSNTRRNNP